MMGLEGRLEKLMVFASLIAGCQQPQNTATGPQGTQDTVDDTGQGEEGNAPYFIENPIYDTASVSEQFTFNIADYVVQDVNGGELHCTVIPEDATMAISSNIDESCYFSWTPSSADSGKTYNVSLGIEDNNGRNNAMLEVVVGQQNSGGIVLDPLTPLIGYTNEPLTGNGTFTGDATTSSLTLDSTLNEVISQATTSLSQTVDYTFIFKNNIDWLPYTDGSISGTAIVEVCDAQNNCDSENLSVMGYAPTEVLITAQTADDKEPLSSATISVDCDSGDTYTLTPNSDGEATAFLNNSDDICTITSDAGSAYAVYSWQHEIGAASEDLVSDGYYEVWAETYDNFTPADLEAEYGESSCYGGKLDSSRNLLMYAGNMLDIVDGTDYGYRTFGRRFAEGELDDTIKYWVSDIDDEGNETDPDLYDDMYNAVQEGLGRINDENLIGYTFFEEAGSINDSNVVFRWDTNQTNTGCGEDSNDVIGTYSSGEYCMIGLHTASSRTVMEEAFNTISPLDLCGDSISDGGTSLTTIDWFVWNTINFAKYPDLMGRTY